MTAQEWDTTANLDALLAAVRGRVSDRKMLLFACSCCRLAEGEMPGAALLAKQFELKVERPMKAEEKFSLLSAVFQVVFGNPEPLLDRLLGGVDQSPWTLASQVASLLRHYRTIQDQPEGESATAAVPPPTVTAVSPEQAAVLREIVGHPFRDIRFDPHWRTETVVGLAAAIEEQAAWDRMPILADALQDAGCDVPQVLAHCRDGDHVHRRGCWVIDAILDRP